MRNFYMNSLSVKNIQGGKKEYSPKGKQFKYMKNTHYLPTDDYN